MTSVDMEPVAQPTQEALPEAPPVPSLLDWLTYHASRPEVQRVFRFGLAALVAGWGLYLWRVEEDTSGYFLFPVAVALVVWGLRARGATSLAPVTVEMARLPELAISRPAMRPAGLMQWLGPLRLPVALFFPILGQMLFSTRETDDPLPGLMFYVLGVALFALVVWHEKLLVRPAEPESVAEGTLSFRLPWLAAAVLAAIGAFWFSAGNRFTTVGVVAWVLSVAAWLVATWEGDVAAALRERARRFIASAREGAFTVRLSWLAILLLGVLALGAYFRLGAIDSIPPEMTSDHAEKILDVADLVLDRQTKIFFDRNTGREPIQFYWTALIGQVFGTGVSFLSLKIGTALFGLLTLPFIFLLGREVEDDTLGLLATFLVAVSFWATAISRVGLRFPLYPLFVAPALYFLLRGLRRNTRNDFLLAGLSLGIGLYGYSPIRALPIAMLVIVGGWLLWPRAGGRRLNTLTSTVLMFATTLIVFVPLLRYIYDDPNDMFWYRTVSRLGESEASIHGSPLALFLDNQWKALLMFNWQGDRVWVNALMNKPVLDFITGALLVLGVGYGLARVVLRRDWVAAVLLLSVPVLMLPSTLSFAFPEENPSVVRTSGAIPVLFVFAAYPLWLLIKRLRLNALGASGLAVSGLTLAALLAGAFALNREMYFDDYPEQYVGIAQNASEIGQVIHDYARTFGSYDTAWVRPFPHWVDTRAVGMYAGNLRRDYAIELADLEQTTSEPRAKLFILHLQDTDATRPDGQPPTLPELRRLYPEGRLSVYHSARPSRDFLIFFVPGTADAIEPAPAP